MRRPAASRIEAVMAAVDPLPLVPADMDKLQPFLGSAHPMQKLPRAVERGAFSLPADIVNISKCFALLCHFIILPAIRRFSVRTL